MLTLFSVKKQASRLLRLLRTLWFVEVWTLTWKIGSWKEATEIMNTGPHVIGFLSLKISRLVILVKCLIGLMVLGALIINGLIVQNSWLSGHNHTIFLFCLVTFDLLIIMFSLVIFKSVSKTRRMLDHIYWWILSQGPRWLPRTKSGELMRVLFFFDHFPERKCASFQGSDC